MNPNDQPRDLNQPSEPTPATGFGAPVQPEPSAPATDTTFSPTPNPAVSPVEPTPSVSSPEPQPFGQPVEATQPAAPQPAFSSPEVAPVGQPPVTPVASDDNPGKTLGIVSIVLSVVGLSLIGLILGIISRKKSKAVGASTTLGTVGMVLGIVFTVLYLLIVVPILLAIIFAASNGIQDKAQSTQTLTDASTLMKYAEAYNIENEVYPASSADIDTSSISEYTTIVETKPSTGSEIQYIKCDDESAQVLYFDSYTSTLEILPLGTASSAIPC